MVFKSVVVIALMVPALAVSYYFAILLPAHNRAVLDFEKQKYADQQANEQLMIFKAEREDKVRKGKLDVCLAKADTDYLDSIRRNGTLSKKGGYDLDMAEANGIQRR